MTSPLMLQVMVGVGIPSAWQSSRTVSPGENIRLGGAFTQYGAAVDKKHNGSQNCGDVGRLGVGRWPSSAH